MPNETLPVAGLGSGSSELAYTVPGGMTFDLMAAFATFDGSGAASSFLPALQILSPTGDIMASTVGSSVAAGGSADVTFAPFLEEEVAAAGTLQNRNLGELGYSIGTTLSDTHTHTLTIQDVLAGDGILVSVSSPSLPSGGGFEGFYLDATDSQGNGYILLTTMDLQSASPGVNTGERVYLLYCPSSVAAMTAGVDSITVEWDSPVYDRIVGAYLVRHDGGPNIPTVLGQTSDGNAAVFASNQVTLTQPDWTPARDEAFTFALIYSARSIAGGQAAYGGVVGWSGFYEASEITKLFTGSKQLYQVHPQTHGADVFVQLGPTITTNEIDIGEEPGGALVPAFNGVAQAYYKPFPTPETNVWKGIILLGLD